MFFVKDILKTSLNFILLLLLSFPHFLYSNHNNIYKPDYDKILQNLDNVNVYLITVDVGSELYMNFGHTILRIKGSSPEFDWVYNWGVFDFNEPFFILKFLKGNLKYKMEEYPYTIHIQTSYPQKRTMWQDKINLTVNQKRKLIDKIIWQSQPENRYFLYLYFKQNCATLPRDYLDYALNGAIQKKYAQELSKMTFRQTVVDHLMLNPFAAMGVDFIFNSNTDKIMSVWEEMFKPKELRRYLSALPAFDDNGNAIASTRLLSDPEVLMSFDPPKASNFNGYHFIFFSLFVPFCYVSWLVLKKHHRNIVRILVGVVAIFWGSFSLFASLVLFWFWLFSYQENCYHNANLWFFWPVDFLCIYIGYLFLINKKISKYLNYFCVLHLIFIILAMILWSVGFIKQDISNTVYFLVPFSFLTYWNILRFENNEIEKMFLEQS